jgi:hypothetical protein
MAPVIAMLQNQINIIVQQLCPCTGGTGTPLTVQEEGVLVATNVTFLNFIGDCITVTP